MQELLGRKMMGEHGELPEEVKNIGRKIRARREDEEKKRREIQRVETSTAPELKNPNETNCGIQFSKPNHRSDAAKKTIPRKRRRSFTPGIEAKNVDRWMPAVDHLSDPSSSKVHRSSVLQLHGLPQGTSPNQIREFFSGITIQRIVVLLSYDSRIEELDASTNCVRKGGLRVERYEPHHLRVFITFDSFPTAAIALQRSGEVIRHTQEHGASLRVTMVSKLLASLLIRTLAIDYKLSDNQSLDTVLLTVQSELEPVVLQVLWTDAIGKLNLSTTSKGKHRKVCCYPILPFTQVTFQLTSQQVEYLQTSRDDLRNVLSALRDKFPFPSAEEWDPSKTDPVLSLRSSCAELLQCEIDRVTHHLLVASRWEKLSRLSLT